MAISKKGIQQISLRPYNGELYIAKTPKDYNENAPRLVEGGDSIQDRMVGRFLSGCGKTGQWTYLVWASSPATLAHELAHVILHVFDRCGITATVDHPEPFCYMLSQLMEDCEDCIDPKYRGDIMACKSKGKSKGGKK